MSQIALLFPDEYLFAHNYFCPFITEDGNEVWNGTRFVVNPREGKFDGIVVVQSTRSLNRVYSLVAPPTRTLLVLKEPPDILFLPTSYTKQFYCTLGQDNRVHSKVKIFSQSGHHWFVEINIREFNQISARPKNKLISAVVSNKSDTEGHYQRLQFMKALKQHFGDQLDWFGRGIKDLGTEKIAGLLDYKYHIVLENSCREHYWTEKLADAFVSNCFPFYWGAPNVYDYFPLEALRTIDIYDIPNSIQVIERAISDNAYDQAQESLLEARSKISSIFHPYQTYLDTLDSLPLTDPCKVIIKPHNEFRHSLATRVKGKIEQYFLST
jgi:Glycosyltransferase family 10 (fucosyltransferase) C-term